jgi:hypothetical protein
LGANSQDLLTSLFEQNLEYFACAMQSSTTTNTTSTDPPPAQTDNENAQTTQVATQASKRGPGFSLVENLLICKAFIAASEDPIVGRSQKGKVFQAKMYKVYSKMIENQAVYDKTMMAQASGITRDAYSATLTGTGLYPVRKEGSIHDRFVRKISPEVCKFMGVLDTTDKESGKNDDDHYQQCLTIYQQRYGHSFDYADCYHYLKDKAKFLLFKQKAADEEKAKAERTRPIGNKAAKKAAQDASLIKQALEELKEPSPSSDVSSISERINGQETFYMNAATFLSKTGDALSSYMQQQQDQLDKQHEKDMLQLMATPEKREVMMEKSKLYVAEIRAKRRKLEESFASTSNELE